MLNLPIYEVPLFLFAALLLLSVPTPVSLPVPTLAISPVISSCSYSCYPVSIPVSPVVLFLFLLSCIYSCILCITYILRYNLFTLGYHFVTFGNRLLNVVSPRNSTKSYKYITLCNVLAFILSYNLHTVTLVMLS